MVKEFENDPRVVVAIMSQEESKETLQEFWENLYLRGPMLFDPDGAVAGDLYDQPLTGLPFGRAFVIGPDHVVELAAFGHDPDRAIDTIRELLKDMPLVRRPPEGWQDRSIESAVAEGYGDSP